VLTKDNRPENLPLLCRQV